MPADLPLICIDARWLPVHVDVRPTELWNRCKSARNGIFRAEGCSGQHSSIVPSWWFLRSAFIGSLTLPNPLVNSGRPPNPRSAVVRLMRPGRLVGHDKLSGLAQRV
ncbi:hypothetical protein U1Q18_043467 [Sarracenia purpurea var. burkii]